jgi:hypothetical protein
MNTSRAWILVTQVTAMLLAPAVAAAQVGEEVTVTVRGIGVTADAAKRDALMAAVYQAVGAYVDSETLVRDDQIIKDQVLQASGSYVHRYDVLIEPAQRKDGLWEMSIRAIVRGGQVQERLKAVVVEQAGIDTKDKVAEALTKIKNAQEGAEILQKQLEGLLPKLLVARLIDSKGKVTEQATPVVTILDDGRLSCVWHVEVYFDAPLYYERVVPPLHAVLSALAAKSGGPATSNSTAIKQGANIVPISTFPAEYPVLGRRAWSGSPPAPPQGDQPHVYVLLSTGRSATGGTEQFQWYLLEGVSYRKALSAVALPRTKISLAVQFLSADGEVVHSETIDPWTDGQFIAASGRRLSEGYSPYFVTPIDVASNNPIQVNAAISPRFARGGGSQATAAMTGYLRQLDSYPVCENGHCDVIVRPFTTVLAAEDLERIKQVRFYFSEEPAEAR